MIFLTELYSRDEKVTFSTFVLTFARNHGHDGYYYKLHPSQPQWFCYFGYNQACWAVTDDFGNLRRVTPYFNEKKKSNRN